MNLGISQKSLKVRLKEEKKRKDHSFFHEQIERRRREQEEIFELEKVKERNSSAVRTVARGCMLFEAVVRTTLISTIIEADFRTAA